MFGELECIREKILQHLLQTFRVRHQTPGEVRVGMHFECKLSVFSLMAERTSHHFEQICKENFFGFDRNRSRLNLREIEDVADEVEQVRPCAMNGSCKFNLLRSQVVIRVLTQLLAQNQNRVADTAELDS